MAAMAPRPPAVRKQHLDALCDELTAVIEVAAACGNEVAQTWTGFGQAVCLQREQPVLAAIPADVLAKLTYRSVRDPHYWLGEIHCRAHPGWFVALPYNTPDAREPTGLPRDMTEHLAVHAGHARLQAPPAALEGNPDSER